MKTFQQFLEMARIPSLSAAEKKKVNNLIHDATKGFHEKIPLQAIFDALTSIGVHAIQEDGTPWQGMLLGGAECGSPEAANQRVLFHLVRTADGSPLNNGVFLSWCKMSSGRYEVVSYLS